MKGKRVAVTMRSGRLGIVGEEGGAIWIDPADVASVRIGYEESKIGKQFLTRIVRKSRPEPLVLHPLGHYDPDYGATIRASRRRSPRPAASSVSSAAPRPSGRGPALS